MGHSKEVNGPLRQNTPQHYNSLGNLSARQGQFSDAEIYYKQALELNPEYAESYNNLGNIYKEQKKFLESISSYEKAIQFKPDFAMAHNNLGIILREQGRSQEAIHHHLRAIMIIPEYAEAHYNLGNALSDQEKYEEACLCFRKALTIKPQYSESYLNLGNALRRLNRMDEAIDCFKAALKIRPNYTQAYYNCGSAFLEKYKLNEAIQYLQQAIALDPNYVNAYLNLGNSFRSNGQFNEALDCYKQALALREDYAEVHVNEGFTRLMMGDFVTGWAKNEWRKQIFGMTPYGLTGNTWGGENLQGKDILLYCEQGLGDSIQFIRYAKTVKDSGAHRVFLLCPKDLARLFIASDGIDQIYTDLSQVPPYDYHAALLSLPHIFRTDINTIPSSASYLSIQEEPHSLWKDRLKSYSGLKVGIVWAGNPRIDLHNAHLIDQRRSIHLQKFRSLSVIPNIHLFSLQKGAPALQIKAASPSLKIIDMMDLVEDFADTAAFISNLDLVIGVDTSVIHLAAALGKPCWVLSRYDGCWRWLLNREDSPWYPSLRIFRQSEINDWSPTIAKVHDALNSYLKDI